MRVVLCDGDDLLRSMVELVVERHGHELVGVADTIGDAIGLVEHARPDIAIVDLALGINADFDLVGTAQSVGARVIVFSNTAYEELLKGYDPRPEVVPKPDLEALGRALGDLVTTLPSPGAPSESTDRRRRPTREVAGPAPHGVVDAQSFYEALNGAASGDGMVWIDARHDGTMVAERVASVMRGNDRLLATPDAIRVFLTGAGDVGVEAFCHRIADGGLLDSSMPIRSIIVGPGEAPTDAFDRLKRG